MKTDTVDTINTVTKMFEDAHVRIDTTVEVGLENQIEIMKRRMSEGLKVRWLMQESFLTKAKSTLRLVEKLPEMRRTPRIIGHINLTDRMAAVSLRRKDGVMGHSAFFGEDAAFLRWANDLFTYEWQNAKIWYP